MRFSSWLLRRRDTLGFLVQVKVTPYNTKSKFKSKLPLMTLNMLTGSLCKHRKNPAPVSKLSFFSYNKAFNELFSKLLLYNPKELKFFQNRAKFDNCHFEGGHTTTFPASRSLSQRGKNERKERDLCRPPPTRFLSNKRWWFLNNQ